MAHVSLEQLWNSLIGRLAEEEEKRVQKHLASGCTTCQENLAWCKKVFKLTQKDDLKEAPEWMVERAIQLFKPTSRRVRLAEKITATLIFDSFSQPSLAGVRRIGILGRQLLFKARSFDIDLRIVKGETPKFSNLMGQILKRKKGFPCVTGLEVTLRKGRKRIQSTQTNRWGEFHFSDLFSGKYKIEIILPDQRIEIKEVEV